MMLVIKVLTQRKMKLLCFKHLFGKRWNPITQDQNHQKNKQDSYIHFNAVNVPQSTKLCPILRNTLEINMGYNNDSFVI